MTTNQEWFDKVRASASLAEFIYNDEVEKVSRKLKELDKKDAREVKFVGGQVLLDAKFAKHHLEYLIKVVDREVARLKRLIDERDEALVEEDEARVERLNKKIAKRAVASDKHIEKVVESVAKHIERDAKAAAKHFVRGLHRLGVNEDEFASQIKDASAKVADAIQKVMEDAGDLPTGDTVEVEVAE